MNKSQKLIGLCEEDLITRLEKAFNTKIKPGRNTLASYPVDIEDQSPEGGIEMVPVDRDAQKGLGKKLRELGFKTKMVKNAIIVS